MGAIIARQPNGLLCRFSTVVDTVTDYNMTDEDFIELMAEKGRDEARFILQHHLHPYDEVISRFLPNNMSERAFNSIRKQMEEQ